MRHLPDLLLPRSSGAFRSGQYAFGATGETRLGFSQASTAVGIDVPTVAAEVRRRVDAFLASAAGPAAAGARDSVLLSALALLDMMTSNDLRRLVLAGRAAPIVAAYCATHGLDVLLLPADANEASPVDAAEHTLLALGLPLHEVAAYTCNPQAVKGIVIAPLPGPDGTRSVVSQFPAPTDEIPTNVDFGTGATAAWLWPRL